MRDIWIINMKIVLQGNQKFIIRFDKGEDVIKGVEDFMAQGKITACSLFGIGSCSEIELGYYNVNLKEYRKKPYFENMEIISFQGSGSVLEGKPTVHAHGMFGKTDFSTLGGHIFKMIVSATCEIFIIQMEGELKRAFNADANLNLLQ